MSLTPYLHPGRGPKQTPRYVSSADTDSVVELTLVFSTRRLLTEPDMQESPMTVPGRDPTPDGRALACMMCKCPSGYRKGNKFIRMRERV